MNKLRVNEYTLTSPKIKADKTILNISDLHGNIEALKSIKEYLKKSKIDFITMPGDITDSLVQPGIEEFAEELKSIEYKNYIALGNHDVSISARPEDTVDNLDEYSLFKKMKDFSNGKFVTEDFSHIQVDDDIDLYVINLPKEYYSTEDLYGKKEVKKSLKECLNKIDNQVNKDKFNILLIHSPNGLVDKNNIIDDEFIKNINLILSGHNHGGLLPPFFQDIFKNNRGLVGAYEKLFLKPAYGFITDEDTTLFVSNGVTKISDRSPFKFLHPFLKLFYLPEIDLIHMSNSDKHELKLENREIYKFLDN